MISGVNCDRAYRTWDPNLKICASGFIISVALIALGIVNESSGQKAEWMPWTGAVGTVLFLVGGLVCYVSREVSPNGRRSDEGDRLLESM